MRRCILQPVQPLPLREMAAQAPLPLRTPDRQRALHLPGRSWRLKTFLLPWPLSPARPRTRRAQWNQTLQLAARVGPSGGLEGTVFLELYDENTFKDAHVGTATLNLQARAGRSPAAAPLLAPFS